jgi:hypothetical protein
MGCGDGACGGHGSIDAVEYFKQCRAMPGFAFNSTAQSIDEEFDFRHFREPLFA